MSNDNIYGVPVRDHNGKIAYIDTYKNGSSNGMVGTSCDYVQFMGTCVMCCEGRTGWIFNMETGEQIDTVML